MPRRLRRLLPVGLALAGVWAAAGGLVARERELAEREALRQAGLYARVLADHTQRTLDTALAGMAAAAVRAEALLAQPGASGAPTGDALQRLLADVAAGQGVLRSLSLVRPDGFVVASSQPGNAGSRLPAGLAQALSAATPAPVLLPASGRDVADLQPGLDPEARHHLLLLPSPPLASADGSRLVAALNPGFLANQHGLLLGDDTWRAALLLLDGTLVVSGGSLDLAPGTQRPLPPGVADGSVEHGRRSGPGLVGDAALGAWRMSRLHPLVAQVEWPQEAALAAWRQDARVALGLAVTGSLLVLGTAAVLARLRRAREQADTERERARAQLREHYETTEQMVDAMPVPVFLTDLSGGLLMANRAFVDWMSLDHEPAPGAAEAQTAASLVQPLLERGISEVQVAGSARWPLDLPQPGGRLRETVVTKVALRGPGGQVRGVIGTLADISEYQQAARATESARRAAEAASQARAEFVANVTHELRTPLQSILGFAELGEGRAGGHDKLQHMFRRVHQAGTRMLRLVDDLLDISRIGSTVGSIQRRPGALDGPLREVVDELRTLAHQRGLSLVLTVQEGFAERQALVDATRLQQVARNIIANAMRFAPAGSAIDIGLFCEDGLGVMQVRDRGPGIPPAELEAIFEPFVQSSRTRDGSGGTGLGLTICRQILQAHGGFIGAANHSGGGAVFRFGVPLVRPGATSDAAPATLSA